MALCMFTDALLQKSKTAYVLIKTSAVETKIIIEYNLIVFCSVTIAASNLTSSGMAVVAEIFDNSGNDVAVVVGDNNTFVDGMLTIFETIEIDLVTSSETVSEEGIDNALVDPDRLIVIFEAGSDAIIEKLDLSKFVSDEFIVDNVKLFEFVVAELVVTDKFNVEFVVCELVIPDEFNAKSNVGKVALVATVLIIGKSVLVTLMIFVDISVG